MWFVCFVLSNRGLAPKKRFMGMETQMDDDDIKKMIARGDIDRAMIDVERIEGLGAAP